MTTTTRTTIFASALLITVPCALLGACSSPPQEHARASRVALTANGDITGAYRFQSGDSAMQTLSLLTDGSYAASVAGGAETGFFGFDGATLSLFVSDGSERDYSVSPNGTRGIELVGVTDTTDEVLAYVAGACNVAIDCAGEDVQPNRAMCIAWDRPQTQCASNACVLRCSPSACATDADCPQSASCHTDTNQCGAKVACPLAPSNDDDNFDALVVAHTWTSADTLASYTFNADRTFASVDEPACVIAQPVHCDIRVAQKTGTFMQTGPATFELDYSDGTVATLLVEMDCNGKIAAAQVSDYSQSLTVFPPPSQQ